MAKEKEEHYRLDKILAHKAQYYMIVGERSNGKTYAILEHCLKEYVKSGYKNEFCILRRWQDDFKPKNSMQMFAGHIQNGVITRLTKGEFNSVSYLGGRWYLAFVDEHGATTKKMQTPFCYGFALNDQEHIKSISFPNIKNIFFDEFLSSNYYLPDEFVIFMNVLSTIIRLRNDVTIFMAGNTINPYAPYFNEMGLKHVKNMKKGEIEVYTYGDSGLKVAVEFSDYCGKKKSNIYFAFDNPKLTMITGVGGTWEIAIYPHLPCKYKPKEILFTYFILFDNEMFQCEIVSTNDMTFTYIHRKTGELKDKGDLIFDLVPNGKPNYVTNIYSSGSPVVNMILSFFKLSKVFYQDNTVGESIRNYLQVCMRG